MTHSLTLPVLDARDLIILRTIQDSWNTRGYAPNLRALAAALHITSTSVSSYRVRRLEARGLLHVPRMPTGELVAHSMRLTELAQQTLLLNEELCER